MSARVMLSVLMACAAPGLVHAAGDPVKTEKKALNKQCESSNGQVEKECKKVAKKMTKEPQPQERTDMTDQDITHSSPVMGDDAAAKAKKAQPAPKPAPKPEPKSE